jgi:hypothetical protein
VNTDIIIDEQEPYGNEPSDDSKRVDEILVEDLDFRPKNIFF